jgi:hypothetical protein
VEIREISNISEIKSALTSKKDRSRRMNYEEAQKRHVRIQPDSD